MKTSRVPRAALVAALAICAALPSHARPGARSVRLPLSFEANRGQTDPAAKFISRGAGYALFLRPHEAVLSLKATSPKHKAAALRMRMVGANQRARMVGDGPLPGKVNYFRGSDPKRWQTNVPTFAKVRCASVYPGIDVVYYGTSPTEKERTSRLEYDFVVKPGADPRRIRLAFDGATSLRVAKSGDLVADTAAGAVTWKRPVAYQLVAGRRLPVPVEYCLSGRRARIQVARYDRSRTLVVDPVLVYSTYLGGSTGAAGQTGEPGLCVAVDSAGCAYISGYTESADFPTSTGAYDRTYDGPGGSWAGDAFVTKLAPDGGSIVYSTFLGGNGDDWGHALAVDAAGCAYVAGSTSATNFPTTSGALQRSSAGYYEVFVTKLSVDGSSLVYSTLIGASEADGATGLAIDGAGCAYVSIETTSPGFPTTEGAYDRAYGGGTWDAAVVKLSTDGAALVYSTLLGGSGLDQGHGIAVDATGCAYIYGATQSSDFPTTPGAYDRTVNGLDVFVARLTPDGGALVYSTVLGATDPTPGAGDGPGTKGIVVDASGCVYVTGYTQGSDFPTTPGAFRRTLAGQSEAFVSKLTADGSGLIWSTLLGGDGADGGLSLALTQGGRVAVIGQTLSSDMPLTGDAVDTTRVGYEPFVAVLSADGTALRSCTFLGGSGDDYPYCIAADHLGALYVSGQTCSADFPTTAAAFQTVRRGASDAFVAKLYLALQTALSVPERSGTVGFPVLLDATLTAADGGAAISGRPVSFAVDGSVVGSATTNASGLAELSWTIPEGPASRTIGASFAGDATYAASSGTGALTVSKAASRAYTIDRSGVGASPVILRGYVYRRSDMVGLANKTLGFKVAGTDVGSVVTNSSGAAYLTWTIDAGPATRQIAVEFAGDTSYEPSSATANLTVLTYDATVIAPGRSGEIGETLPLKGYLYRSSPAFPVAGKALSFRVYGTEVGSAMTNAQGRALLSWVVPDSLAPGSHAYQVVWAGDAGYRSGSASPTLAIEKGASFLWLASRSIARGTSGYLRAYLRRLPDYAWLVGRTVQFAVDGSVLGTAVTDADGRASYLYAAPAGMATGSHSMTAEFAGDDRYHQNASGAVLTVTP